MHHQQNLLDLVDTLFNVINHTRVHLPRRYIKRPYFSYSFCNYQMVLISYCVSNTFAVPLIQPS
jgi:hypothetical protein